MILKHEYLLVEKVKEEKTTSGIILAIETQNRQLVGIVKAIGSDINDRDLEIGSKIVFDNLNASDIEIEGIAYRIIEYSDVIAVL